MHTTSTRIALFTVALALAGCSSPSIQGTGPGGVGQFSVTINTQPDDTPEDLAARYAGEVIVWRPEDGFAIVRTNTAPGNDPNVKGVDRNQNTVKAPVLLNINKPGLNPQNTAKSGNVWMGGWSAWSGGWSAWSGGWSAWSGGSSTPTLPPENNAVFNIFRLPQAHQVSRNFGAGVKVAVIDTGLDTAHPMFSGRLAPAAEWKDYVDGDTNPQEVGTEGDRGYGHGTGVAGIILQVAPKATILPLRVLDKSGQGDLDKVVQAVDWAIQKGANVINLSLGANQSQTSLTQVLQLAASRKVYVIASAGNDAQNGTAAYPAEQSNWVGVQGYLFGIGSLNNQDIISSYSNTSYGLFASGPGESIYSAFPGNRVAAFTGTSFAAPIYTGAVALGLKELPTGGDASRFSTYFLNSMRAGSLWSENRTARNNDQLGNGRLNVEGLIRNLPGWTPKVAYNSTNLIKNGSFETGSTSNWGVFAGPVSVVTGNASSGTYALKLDPGRGADQVITGLKANTTYTVSAMIRNAQNDSAGVNLGVYNHGGPEFQIEVRGTTYARRFVTFTTGPSNTSATIVLNNYSGNPYSAFFDDVTLRETTY